MKRILSVAFATLLTMTPWAFAMEMEKEGKGESKLHWHGYGELHYNHPEGSGVPKPTDNPELDFHRMVWGMTYHFTDAVSLHTEIDFEHAARELELEFSYIDFLKSPALNFRVGAMLMPVGPLNEVHEPTLFYSVERPRIQSVILPTTWTEPGVGIFGETQNLKYRFYIVNGLDGTASDASDKQGFFPGSGIREGRQFFKKKESIARERAGVLRVEYTGVPGLAVGGSFYKGGADNDDKVRNSIHVTLWDLDLRFRRGGLDVQAIIGQSSLDGLPATSNVGTEQSGTMLEVAYRFGKVVPFIRHEAINTQKAPPTGLDLANDQTGVTLGLAYYPVSDVALKADYEKWENGKGVDGSRFNLGAAYMF